MAGGIRKLLEIMVGATQIIFSTLLLINIGAGTEPFDDPALHVVCGQGAPHKPAPSIFVAIPEAVLHLVRLPCDYSSGPSVLAAVHIVGVQDGIPAHIKVVAGETGELVPALVVVIDMAVGTSRPNHLGHRIGKLAESGLARQQSLSSAHALDQVSGDPSENVEELDFALARTAWNPVVGGKYSEHFSGPADQRRRLHGPGLGGQHHLTPARAGEDRACGYILNNHALAA